MCCTLDWTFFFNLLLQLQDLFYSRELQHPGLPQHLDALWCTKPKHLDFIAPGLRVPSGHCCHTSFTDFNVLGTCQIVFESDPYKQGADLNWTVWLNKYRVPFFCAMSRCAVWFLCNYSLEVALTWVNMCSVRQGHKPRAWQGEKVPRLSWFWSDRNVQDGVDVTLTSLLRHSRNLHPPTPAALAQKNL